MKVAGLVALSTPAFLPEERSSVQENYGQYEDREIPSGHQEKCKGKRSRRIPSSMTVDLSVIDTSYLNSLVELVGDESRSLAPWDYSLNVDPNRYPHVISEANCHSLSCTDSDGKVNRDLISLPIQHDMMVLRREQKDCDYVYRLESQRVTLGCTCARPAMF
ncbi:interleukin-17F-like [Rhinophrynus dorsalis]